jgi:hypothetical protein
VGVYFLQVPDCDVDRSSQINRELGLNIGLSVAKPDNFSAQRNTLESHRNDGGRTLINRYRQKTAEAPLFRCEKWTKGSSENNRIDAGAH